jgi:transcriptional regulator with XRE-family HTH domain
MALLDMASLNRWVKKSKIRQSDLAKTLGLKDRSTISRQLNSKSALYANQLCKIISLFDEKLPDRTRFADFLREVVGIDLEAPVVQREVISTDLVDALKDLAQARKELNEQKDRTHVLEKAIYTYEHRLMCDHRSSDPPELNPTKMRRAVKFDSDHKIHP